MQSENMFQLPPVGNRPESVEKYIKRSLDKLGLDYVDMYLIHVPFGFLEKGEELHPVNEDGTILLDKTTNHIEIWKVSIIHFKITFIKSLPYLYDFLEKKHNNILDHQ